ncbi:LuxR C-terminal-related transcriptional regulator [Streptomyces sp. NPDC046866]|uniref:LuxR C-terminal-related transcriptional regulator n=1 Tax=Streptomyces sp. NPDC046866 TaxID=3154921 RepID=UPI0034541D53
MLDLLTLLAEGRTLQQIAHDWDLEPGTVRIYAARLRRYLGADTNPQAVYLACRAGILDGRPQRHGDHAGYEAHRKRGETPCDDCRAGEKAHRARYATPRKRQTAPERP